MSYGTISSKKFRIIESLYFLLLGIYLLYAMSINTTYYLPFPKSLTLIILGILSILAGLKVIIYCIDSVKDLHHFPWEVLLAMLPALSYFLSYLSGRYTFLLVLAVATLGCLGSDYRKLLALYSCVAGVFLLGTTLCALCGGIKNFVYVKDGYMRSSWGVYYPTDYAAFLIYIAVAGWIAAKKVKNYVFLILAVLITALSHFVMRSDTSTLCGLLFVLILLYMIMMEAFGQKNVFLKVLAKIVDCFSVASFTLFACLVFGLVYIYRKGIPLAYRINDLMSSRLYYASAAFDKYGISLFGKTFSMIGFGGSTFFNENYNFIDSSYALILIRCGLVTFLVIGLLWTMTSFRAIRIRDRRLALGMALIAFHSISEHHFIDIYYNILLVMPFAFYAQNEPAWSLQTSPADSGHESPESPSHRISPGSELPHILSGLLVMGLMAAFFIFLFPEVLSRARTLTFICKVYQDPWKKLVLFLIMVAASALFAGFMASCYGILSSVFKKRVPQAGFFILLPLCALILFSLYGQSGRIIKASMKNYRQELTDTQAAVKAILIDDKAKLYVDRIPEIFDRRFGGVSKSIFSGEELARYDDISVIMPANIDSNCFLSKGYLYCQISPKYAIYTKDESAIRRLSESGYHLTGYFSKKRKVDLDYMAKLNGLSLSEDGSLSLKGKDQALKSGPNIELRDSKYTTTFKLAMDPGTAGKKDTRASDRVVCTLRISTYSGANLVKEVPVSLSDFNKDGLCKEEIKYEIPESIGVEFLVLPEKDYDITVRAIGYQQTPDYDTHKFYDAKNRLIREDFYDLDGNRCRTDTGFSSCTYEYDEQENISVIRYYDHKNKLTMTTMGYAMIHRVYNLKRQIIREEYYDTKEKLLMQESGYAAVEYSYDANDNQVELRYYDTDNQPALANGSYAKIQRSFDQSHRIIKEEYFDDSYQLVNRPEGYAVAESSYDENGNRDYLRYYNAEHKPATTSNGYAAVHWLYNDKNQIIREEYYGEKENPVALPSGQAAVEYEYDKTGNQILLSYYDKDNKPTMIWDSYSKEGHSYNDKNQLTQISYYDCDGRPIACAWGYALELREYDDDSNLISQRFCDLKGNLVLRLDGYAMIQKSYDDKGNLIKEEYFDTEGNLVHP